MVKKTAAILAAGTIFAAPMAASAQCPDANDILRRLFPEQHSKLEVVEQTRVTEGLCAAFVKEAGNFLVRMFNYTENGEYAVFGKVVKTADASPWGMDILQKYSKLDEQAMSRLEELSVVAGTAPKRIYMVTDPLCPYCKKAIEELKPAVEKGEISLGLVFLPVHEESAALIEHVLCSKGDLLSVYLNSPNVATDARVSCDTGKAKGEAMTGFLRGLGIGGTPTFVGRDGQVITGYVPVPVLMENAIEIKLSKKEG
jgi:thiol:disulfide interchange protein DsbC